MTARFCVLRGCRCRIGRGFRVLAGANDNDGDDIARLLAELAPIFSP